MKRIFYPESIVVFGVSTRPKNMGQNIIINLREFGYRGETYAVGRERGEVLGVPIYDSVDELPQGIDLAVFLVPAHLIPDLLEECGRKGIRRAVIESAGFSEFSEEGRRLEERLLETAQRWGIRFVGPNCIAIINRENGLSLPFIPLSRSTARRGRVSIVSQSGGVALSYANLLSVPGLGVNKIVSIGNKTDLDEIDYLEYLIADEGTELIILYLESIDEGRRLMELAQRSDKPILLHKAHRGTASREIARSHTAALANDDRVVSAAARQAGMVRVADFRAAVDYAKALLLPPVRGASLAIITRTGGHAVIAADGAEAAGFRLYRFPEDFLDKVQGLFRAKVIRPTNPLDLGDLFDLNLYARITEECLRMEGVDAVLLVHTYGMKAEREESHRLVQEVRRLTEEYNKPVALTLFFEREELAQMERELDWPFFTGIEDALGALAAARDYHRRRMRLTSAAPLAVSSNPGIAGDNRIAEILTRRAGQALPLDAALELIAAAGLPVAPWVRAAGLEEAIEGAKRIGYPLVLKVISPAALHKSDVGGVVLNIADGRELEGEYHSMLARLRERVPEAEIEGVLLQRMASGGQELILGGRRERAFGPAVLLGLGGIYAELLERTTIRVAPLAEDDAEEMIAELNLNRLMGGFRGGPPLDRGALIASILKLSQLLIAQPQIAELDINPLLLLPEGVLALDARVLLG